MSSGESLPSPGREVQRKTSGSVKKDTTIKTPRNMQTRRITKKICLLGDPAVGKTSLIHKYVFDIFGDDYLSTVGAKVVTKNKVFEFPEKEMRVELKMLIWDIAGQKAVESVHEAYFRGAEAAIVVADITRRQTFESVASWIREVFHNTGEIPVLLLVNKIDLEDQMEFTIPEIEERGASFNLSYLLTSAKNGKNVENAFETIGLHLASSVL